MPVKVTCPICDTSHKRKPSKKHLKCCSNECGQKLRSRNAISNHDVDEYKRLYLEEKKSLREIAENYDYHYTTIKSVLKKSGVKLRHGSEAIKTQWIDADERREKTSEIFKCINKSHGKTDEYNDYTDSKQHRKWRKDVKERDNHTCQDCGSTKNLHAHHIKGIIEYPELRTDLDNGVTLCQSCHLKRHQ